MAAIVAAGHEQDVLSGGATARNAEGSVLKRPCLSAACAWRGASDCPRSSGVACAARTHTARAAGSRSTRSAGSRSTRAARAKATSPAQCHIAARGSGQRASGAARHSTNPTTKPRLPTRARPAYCRIGDSPASANHSARVRLRSSTADGAALSRRSSKIACSAY